MQGNPLSPDGQRTLSVDVRTSRTRLSSDEDVRRLEALSSFITQVVMKGTFPERTGLAGVTRLLDVSCGTGFWARTVATANPEIEIMGVDSNAHLVEFARDRAFGLENVQFSVMDSLVSLPFFEPFDLVNAQMLSSVLPANSWPFFIKDCLRLLRPGGVLRLIDAEYPFTTSYACERFGWWYARALKLSGLSFSPDGRQVGITPMLGYLLRTGIGGGQQVAGGVERKGYVLDCSSDTLPSSYGRQAIASVLSLLRPFLETNADVLETTSEEIAQTYRQALADVVAQNFRAVCYLLLVWAVKPHG